jgi:hypothetical protein
MGLAQRKPTAPRRLKMQQLPGIEERFATLDKKLDTDNYNLKHFRTIHIIRDGAATVVGHGLKPGEEAPDFVLPRADGGEFRLSNLRGKPVLLRFGSGT